MVYLYTTRSVHYVASKKSSGRASGVELGRSGNFGKIRSLSKIGQSLQFWLFIKTQRVYVFAVVLGSQAGKLKTAAIHITYLTSTGCVYYTLLHRRRKPGGPFYNLFSFNAHHSSVFSILSVKLHGIYTF